MGSLRASIALPLVSAPCVSVTRRENLSVSVPQAGENGGFVTQKRGPLIADIPLEYIRRPLLRTRNNDPEKVKQLMDSIAEIGLQEPVSLLSSLSSLSSLSCKLENLRVGWGSTFLLAAWPLESLVAEMGAGMLPGPLFGVNP